MLWLKAVKTIFKRLEADRQTDLCAKSYRLFQLHRYSVTKLHSLITQKKKNHYENNLQHATRRNQFFNAGVFNIY